MSLHLTALYSQVPNFGPNLKMNLFFLGNYKLIIQIIANRCYTRGYYEHFAKTGNKIHAIFYCAGFQLNELYDVHSELCFT